MLAINNLTAQLSKNKQTVLHDLSLKIADQSVNYLLGPNGSGKSSLLHTIMGSLVFQATTGSITLGQTDLLKLPTEERAKKGLFLSFQEPPALPGVKVIDYLYNAYIAMSGKQISSADFYEIVVEHLDLVRLPTDILSKELNLEFSGGEKKRLELLSMLTVTPKYVFLDELDSGLDIDSVKVLFQVVKEFYQNYRVTLVIVSHHFQVAKILPPDKVFVLKHGTVEQQGDAKLLQRIEKSGFYS